MANREQLEILKQGVDVWNKWRSKNPEQVIDLSKVDLSGTNLKGAILREADLREADLHRANLTRGNLYKADLRRANMREANLSEAILVGARIYEGDLDGAVLMRTVLSGLEIMPKV